MTWDVAPGCDLLTQAYGCTDNTAEWYEPTLCASGYFHAGVDISKTGGSCFQPVLATRMGVVRAVGIPGRPALGPDAVWVEIDGGISLLYGHLAAQADCPGFTRVSPGWPVTPGSFIGCIGTQGVSTGCHLHLEARATTTVAGGAFAGVIDPSPYLDNLPVTHPIREPAMLVEEVDDAGNGIAWWIVGADGKRHLGPRELQAWIRAGYGTSERMLTAELAAIPDVS